MQSKTLVKLAVAGVLAGSMAAANAGTVTLTSDQSLYNVGDSITITYTMDFSSDPTIGGGTDFFFDDTLMSYDGWTWNPAFSDGPAGSDNGATPGDEQLSRNPDLCGVSTPNCFSGNDANNRGAELNGLGWGNFGGLSGPFVVGTLTFTAIDAGIVTIDMAFNEDAPPSNPGPFFDSSGNPSQVDFIGATFEISQVPVPAAVWLFLSGLGGLLGFGRRRG